MGGTAHYEHCGSGRPASLQATPKCAIGSRSCAALHSTNSQASTPWVVFSRHRDLLRCLNTALIVSYWRPFSANRNTSDERSSLPEKRFLKAYTAEERAIHQHIERYRDRDHAHSSRRPLHPGVGSVMNEVAIPWPTGRDQLAPLPEDWVVRLEVMIEKLDALVSSECQRIQQTLDPGVSSKCSGSQVGRRPTRRFS